MCPRPPDDPPGRRGARLLLAVVLAATVLTAFIPRDLWTPDEQRYGQVPREILRDGDPIVLHLNGEPYAEKPPLFFWAVALLSWPHGDVTSFTARLAGCLFAAGAFLVLWILVRRWFGSEGAATTAVLIFATNLLLLHNATRATMDMTLTCFVLLAVERGSAWLRRGGGWRGALLGLAWAAAVLAKGPLGLLLPFFALAGEAVGLERRPRWRDPGWILAPLVLALASLAWLLPALQAGGEAYRHRLLGQIASRATGAERHAVHGALWYVGILLAAGLPWSFHFLAGALRAATPWRVSRADRAGLLAATGGGLGGLLVLFLVATKREVYLIPTLPFLAAAAALALERATFRRLLRVGTMIVVASPAVGALLCLLLPFTGSKIVVKGAPWPTHLFDGRRFLLLLPALLVFAWGFRRTWRVRLDPRAAAARAGLALVLGALALKAGYFPSVDPAKSFAAAARAANQAAGGGEVVTAGPVWRDWLWNLGRTQIRRAETLANLADDVERGGAAALVEAKWWNLEHARLGPGDGALRRRLRALERTWEGTVEHRTWFVLRRGAAGVDPPEGEAAR